MDDVYSMRPVFPSLSYQRNVSGLDSIRAAVRAINYPVLSMELCKIGKLQDTIVIYENKFYYKYLYEYFRDYGIESLCALRFYQHGHFMV